MTVSKPPQTPDSSRVSAAQALATRSRKILHYLKNRRLTPDDRRQIAGVQVFASTKYNEKLIRGALQRWLRACQRMAGQTDKARRDLAKLLSRGRIESIR